MPTPPRIEPIDQLRVLTGSAAALGYRWPAEWEPVEAVWLSRPSLEMSWPDCLDKAIAEFDAWIAKLRPLVRVRVVQDEGISAIDSWMRDMGPIFVVDAEGRVACHDFRFNCWGGKWDDWKTDDLVAQHVALKANLPVWVHDFVLEGGGIDGNGRGDLLTTESCLLNPNRNPGMTHDRMEQHLRDTLGVQRIVWLPGGMADDDTDGHVDTVARFIGPNLVAAVRAEPGHPDHDVLAENRRRLVEAGYGVVDLPLPARRTVTYPDAGGFGAGQRVLTQTYANFLFVNGTLRVPVYGDPQDEVALRRLDDALPGFRVEPVSSRWLIVGGGSLHCLSVQQPVRRG